MPVKKVNFNHMWFWRMLFYWTAVQWVTQKTHTGNSKLHQTPPNFLIYQQLLTANKQTKQRPKDLPWALVFSRIEHTALMLWAYQALQGLLHCSMQKQSIGIFSSWGLTRWIPWPSSPVEGLWSLKPQELLTPVSEAEPQRQLHPKMMGWSKNDHRFSSISFQLPVFNACFVKIWKSQFWSKPRDFHLPTCLSNPSPRADEMIWHKAEQRLHSLQSFEWCIFYQLIHEKGWTEWLSERRDNFKNMLKWNFSCDMHHEHC